MNDTFEGPNLVELIALLEEVPEPPAIAMTPQTPGWIVVGFLLLAALTALLVWLWRRWHANAYRRAALAELVNVHDDAAAMASIVRRTALTAYPRAEIVPLVGNDWLAFLDSTYPGTAFQTGPGRALASAPYRDQVATPALRKAAIDWVRTHRAEP